MKILKLKYRRNPIETQEDGLFHCWYTLTNFENNKAVAPVDFEFFLHGMLVLYIYHTTLH